jgi:hypothetical protein
LELAYCFQKLTTSWVNAFAHDLHIVHLSQWAGLRQTAEIAVRSASEAAYLASAFRNAAQRRFVASAIALRPAALSLRFLRAGAVREAAPDRFLDPAHLFRWAAAIRARAAADIPRRFFVAGAVPSVALGFNI